jgi:hypothetical protein
VAGDADIEQQFGDVGRRGGGVEGLDDFEDEPAAAAG